LRRRGSAPFGSPLLRDYPLCEGVIEAPSRWSMGRNEELAYDRGDILYMAGATIAAIGDTLGHRWARYLDKDFWETKLNSPEATEARAEWLREAYEILKEHRWKDYDRILQEGFEKLPELNSGVFYLKDKDARDIYDLVAVIGNTTSPQSSYLDLVMHIDPVVRKMTDVWLEWEERQDAMRRGDYTFRREPTPPPFSDEAKMALKKGALEYLVERTYRPDDIPGIDRPNVSVKRSWLYEDYEGRAWGFGTLPDKPPVPHPGTVHHNIEHLHYEHATGTGRGEFRVSYECGVYDFHFRVVRGGEYRGLTAIETHVRVVEQEMPLVDFSIRGDERHIWQRMDAQDALLHQITPLAEERHYIFAVDTLREIGERMGKYGVDLPYWVNLNPAVEKIRTLAEIIREEYEAKFGRFPERGGRNFDFEY
jgi:hypothetical protein